MKPNASKSRSDRLSGAPLHTKYRTEEFYSGLDAGIRFAVRVLHAAGLDTCQSCQGGDGHSYLEPSVDMDACGDGADGFAALAALNAYGLEVSAVSIVWNVRHGLPYEKLWRLTLTRAVEERAEERPLFVWCYQAQEG